MRCSSLIIPVRNFLFDSELERRKTARRPFTGLANPQDLFFKIESPLSKPAISYSMSQEMGYEPLLYYQRPEVPTLRSPALSSSLLCNSLSLISRSLIDLGLP